MEALSARNFPKFFPKADEPLRDWLNNYAVQFPIIAPKYGFTADAIALVVARCVAVSASLTMVIDVRAWLDKWIAAKNNLQTTNPADPSVKVQFPAEPKWIALPPEVEMDALEPVMESGRALLGKKNFSPQDRTALLLEKASPVKPRKESAETLDYPFTSLKAENGVVICQIKRGTKYKGKTAQVMMNTTDKATYELLDKTGDKEVRYKPEFVGDQVAMTVTLTAVYVENGGEISKWSPPQSVTLYKSVPGGVVAPDGLLAKQAVAAPVQVGEAVKSNGLVHV